MASMPYWFLWRLLLLLVAVSSSSSYTYNTHDNGGPSVTPFPGCSYKGRLFPPYTKIDEGYDPHTNRCWVTYCDLAGNVVMNDYFNCKEKPAPTTYVPPNPKPRTTEPFPAPPVH